MPYFLFILKTAFDDLKKNKLRTFLTSLGILVGIFSVVLLMSLGFGLKNYMQDQFKSLGSNLIMIMPGKISGNIYQMRQSMMNLIFDEKDLAQIKKNKDITAIAPVLASYSEMKGDTGSEVYEFIASNQDIFEILNAKIEIGQLFTRGDLEHKHKIVVLGSKPAEKLFGDKYNALGKILKIDNISYKVIGVLKEQGGGFSTVSIDEHIYAPYSGSHIENKDHKFLAFYAKSQDEKSIENVKSDINTTLLKRYHEDDFSIMDQKDMLNIMGSIFDVINILLIAIATISLIVGGVGIMNIMFVSVFERIHEIGIRRAFGATKNDILYLFLSESIILSLLGGIAGLSLTYIIVFSIHKIFPAVVDPLIVMMAIGVSTAIGIIFGILPSKKAADLTPVEAIRYE